MSFWQLTMSPNCRFHPRVLKFFTLEQQRACHKALAGPPSLSSVDLALQSRLMAGLTTKPLWLDRVTDENVRQRRCITLSLLDQFLFATPQRPFLPCRRSAIDRIPRRRFRLACKPQLGTQPWAAWKLCFEADDGSRHAAIVDDRDHWKPRPDERMLVP